MTRTKIQPLEHKNSWLSGEGMSATLHSPVAQPPHQLLAGKLINIFNLQVPKPHVCRELTILLLSYDRQNHSVLIPSLNAVILLSCLGM
jgi:hypothetical protein